ncbi:hypothetical protein P618_200229 [Holospora obtusa F1]|uniref:Uncharacterized protein n=1 Tax=Holospora obtusa F1 TaxID=1399147 RepID=W6TEE8_HOLOB|nr:hypothetical protein [Holospora obtusa]ETZ07593.1 hypothetical protein P618_200229 [Holospora obtusa F1]
MNAIKLLVSKKADEDVIFLKKALQEKNLSTLLKKKFQSFFLNGSPHLILDLLDRILSKGNCWEIAQIIISHISLGAKNFRADNGLFQCKRNFNEHRNHINDEYNAFISHILSHDNHVELAKAFIKNINWKEYKDFLHEEDEFRTVSTLLSKYVNPKLSKIFFQSIEWKNLFEHKTTGDIANILSSPHCNPDSSEILEKILKLINWKQRKKNIKSWDVSAFPDQYSRIYKTVLFNAGPFVGLLFDEKDFEANIKGLQFNEDYTANVLKNFLYLRNEKIENFLLSKINFSDSAVSQVWNMCLEKTNILVRNPFEYTFEYKDTTALTHLLLNLDFSRGEETLENKTLIALKTLASSDCVYAEKMLDKLIYSRMLNGAFLEANFCKFFYNFKFSSKEDTIEYVCNNLHFERINPWNSRIIKKRNIRKFNELSKQLLYTLVYTQNQAVARRVLKINFWETLLDEDLFNLFLKSNSINTGRALVTQVLGRCVLQPNMLNQEVKKKILKVQENSSFKGKNFEEIHDTLNIVLDSSLTNDTKKVIDQIDGDTIHYEKFLREQFLVCMRSAYPETVQYLITDVTQQ